MWGNLADRLGATDINATLEKIGNAVAPREDDDDDDDEYYEDEDGDDDEYYEDDDDGDDDGEDEGHREGIMNKVAGASPFRLAGMLTRVLDDHNHDRHPEVVGKEDVNDEDEDDEEDRKEIAYRYNNKNKNKNKNNNSDNKKVNALKQSYGQERNRNETPKQALFQTADEKIGYNSGDINNAGNDSHVEETNTNETRDALQERDTAVRVPDQRPAFTTHPSYDDKEIEPNVEAIPFPAATVPISQRNSLLSKKTNLQRKRTDLKDSTEDRPMDAASNGFDSLSKPEEDIPTQVPKLDEENVEKKSSVPETTTTTTTMETKIRSTTRTKTIDGSKRSHHVAKMSSVRMDDFPVRSKIGNDLGHDNDTIRTDKNEPLIYIQQPLDPKEEPTNIPSKSLSSDIPIVTRNGIKQMQNEEQEETAVAKQNGDEYESVEDDRKDTKPADKPPTAATTNVMEKVENEVAKEKNRSGVVEGEDIATTKTETAASTTTTTPESTETSEEQAVSPLADNDKHEELRKLSSTSKPENTVEIDDGDDDDEKEDEDIVGSAENIIKTSIDESNELFELASPLHLPIDNEIPPEHTVQSESRSQNETESISTINIIASDTHAQDKPPRVNEATEQKLLEAEFNCKDLQIKLELANQEMEALQSQAQRDKEKAEAEREDLITQFHSKEARLLQATSEENQNETLLLGQEFSEKIQNLEQLLAKERKESQDEQAEYKKLLRVSYSDVDRTENQLKATVNKYENNIAQAQQREERALRKVDDRMAQTMAVLDERDEEISRLKTSIRSMESKVNEHQEGEEEAEDELEELHQENDSLRQTIEKLELEKKNLKDQVGSLKSGSKELSGLQMELTMLKEEYNRERTKNQTVVDSAMSSRTQIESERDNALSELRDSKQQLAAALGDLEIARADNSRIMTANNNLQSALEAFQDERQAEMEMIDEQRRESEEAIKSAHATATSAIRQIHETETYDIQKASDNAVKNVMHEMEIVQGTIEKLKSEKNQMRRSLDEAIHRLQTTQEDVIDRNVMKNILLDWCTLNEKNKRHQVLQIMANLLHFSEDEREKVHLSSNGLDSVGAKVVGALTAPLPPSKADVEHLEGSNVHEKWVNFLMAETDDG